MTTRELAEFFGKSVDTISRASKKAGLYNSKGKTRNYDKEEVEKIARNLYNTVPLFVKQSIDMTFAKPVGGHTANAEVLSTNQSVLTTKDIELISTLTSNIVSKIFANLDYRVSKIETRVEQRQALLPPPEIAPRDRVNMLVRQYASKNGMPFQDAWRDLYKEFYYRTHSNAQLCAKNRSMTVLDYIESEGQMELLESIASDL